jgi:hypothetical protein
MRRPVGFLVWNPSRSLPTVQHETFSKAEAEAVRLSAQHPDEAFWIMSPVKGEKTRAAAKAFSDGKAEGMAQAHAEIMLAEGHRDRLFEERDHLRRSVEKLGAIDANRSEFQAIVADCLLWFDGFNAGFSGKEPWERPHTPDREKLTALNGALQALLRSADLDEIPF